MNTTELGAALDSIHDIEAQAQTLEDAVTAIDDVSDVALVAPVLGVFERCGAQDDFGMFGSLVSWMERHSGDPGTRRAVQASVERAPSWPTIQLLPAFATRDEARAVLGKVVESGSFRDRRYTPAWLQTRLDEL